MRERVVSKASDAFEDESHTHTRVLVVTKSQVTRACATNTLVETAKADTTSVTRAVWTSMELLRFVCIRARAIVGASTSPPGLVVLAVRLSDNVVEDKTVGCLHSSTFGAVSSTPADTELPDSRVVGLLDPVVVFIVAEGHSLEGLDSVTLAVFDAQVFLIRRANFLATGRLRRGRGRSRI